MHLVPIFKYMHDGTLQSSLKLFLKYLEVIPAVQYRIVQPVNWHVYQPPPD